MAKRKPLDLSSLDDKLLDGLKFCLRVYDLLDQIRAEPDGLGKIRLLKSKREKRLLEELLPLTRYIQARYDAGNRLKLRWLSGSQPYDAIIWTPLRTVKHTSIPRKIFVEVTTSQHENTHLSRRQLHETGGSFGPKGIRINKETRVPDSAPHVSSGGENIGDLACQILSRIGDKAKKAYPSNTTLIVNCETNTVILEDEWKEAITQVENAGIHKTFREVFLTAPVARHTATLWGARKKR
jgi:hypothetical protein